MRLDVLGFAAILLAGSYVSFSQVNHSAPTLEELQNATYHGFEHEKGPVRLTDGSWEGKPYAEGGASRPRVSLVFDFRVVGDVNSDGMDEAVVLLSEDTGGSGSWLYLALVDREAGLLRNVATQLLGDRVEVRDARIEDGRIFMEVVEPGEGDAMCCPGELITRIWQLRSEGLEEVASIKSGRLSLATVSGNEWVLKNWTREEAAPASPEVTIVYKGGKVTGKSGCNSYFAEAKDGTHPGDILIGPVGATRMMCPESEMQVEDRFLIQFGDVKKFGFLAGLLVLTYERDGSIGTMLFARRRDFGTGMPTDGK